MGIAIPGRQKESTLDKVAKGLQVANSLIGVVGGIQSIRKASADIDATEEGQRRIKEGILTPKEQLEYSKDYNASDVETPGSFGLKTPQEKPVFYSPKTKPSESKGAAPLGQKDVADLQDKGFAIVPVGTRGATTYSAFGADGQVAQIGLVPPKRTDPNATPVLTEQQKLAKLNASEKQRYDNVIMANDAVKDMALALGKGGARYSLIGDNDYTAALARFDEALGRMQSGGAINKEERASFTALARSLLDDPKMQLQKLDKLKGIMADRYKTLGFDPSKNDRFAYEIPKNKAARPGGAVNEAQAGQVPTPKGQVKISNGEEILFVPTRRLKEAMADGFKVVE